MKWTARMALFDLVKVDGRWNGKGKTELYLNSNASVQGVTRSATWWLNDGLSVTGQAIA